MDSSVVPPVNQTCHGGELLNMTKFQFKRILDISSTRKMIAFEATYHGERAVVRLEKTIMEEKSIHELLADKGCQVMRDFHNDIYGNYFAAPTQLAKNLNSIKTTVVHPATDAVITKYSRHECSFIEETSDDYYKFVEPHVIERLGPNRETIRWVYNILEHKSETERLVLDLPDQDVGFIMTPDLKWGGTIDDLYMLAISYRRDIKSLRDLNRQHLPLLENILTKGTEIIVRKYQVAREKLRVFVHYQPTFYHFHVHFKNDDASGDSSVSHRDNLLATVINNIKMRDDYYQKATLTYPLAHIDPLYQLFKTNKK